MASQRLLPILFLVVSCGNNEEFDPNTVDPGGDPGPPWLNGPQDNADPEPEDDEAETFDGHYTVINVVKNDYDPDFNWLTVTKVTNPDDGDAELNDDGTITYTPDNDFVGEDSFKYTVEDGRGGSAKATVTVTVTGSATLAITSPADQAAVDMPFDLAYEFSGDCSQVPDFEQDQGCHLHILLDGDVANLDLQQGNDIIYDGSPFPVLDATKLTPGEHTLGVILYRNNGGHLPFDAEISAEITVFVSGDTGDTGLGDTGLGDTGLGDTGDTSDTGAIDTSYTDTGDTAY